MLERVLTRFFEARPALQDQGPLIVAVSGGRDSICLLHWLTHSSAIQAQIVAVAIDHRLRPESAAECEQVRQTAMRWGADCVVRQTSLTAETFTENRGRIARYNILQQAADQVNASYILTGHHAGDQAESVLLHLLRGSGLNGLTGMRERAALPILGASENKERAFTLVRPMLDVTPVMLDRYAAKYQLPIIDDPSNHDETYTRNRIRHTLIPLIEKRFNPQIQKNLSQTAQILADDFAALEQLHLVRWEEAERDHGVGWGTFEFASWESGGRSFQRFALRKLYQHVYGSLLDLGQENLEAARLGLLQQKTDKRYQLSGVIWVQKVYDRLLAYHLSAADLFDMPQLANAEDACAIDPTEAGEIFLQDGGWKLVVQPVDVAHIDLEEAVANRWVAFVALKEFDRPLFLRGRRQSEAFRPFRMNGDVYLKKLMIDRKIPAILRDRWPLLADETGILWVAGHRLAERAAITAETRYAVKLSLEKVSGG